MGRELQQQFIRACARGTLEEVKELVAAGGFDINAVDYYNMELHTGLQAACYDHRVDICEYLLGLPDIDPNHENWDSMACLFVALGARDLKILHLLLDHPRTNVNLVQMKCGDTPLEGAILHDPMLALEILARRTDVDVTPILEPTKPKDLGNLRPLLEEYRRNPEAISARLRSLRSLYPGWPRAGEQN